MSACFVTHSWSDWPKLNFNFFVHAFASEYCITVRFHLFSVHGDFHARPRTLYSSWNCYCHSAPTLWTNLFFIITHYLIEMHEFGNTDSWLFRVSSYCINRKVVEIEHSKKTGTCTFQLRFSTVKRMNTEGRAVFAVETGRGGRRQSRRGG